LKRNWKIYLLWIGLSEAVGLLAGLLTREGTALYAAEAVKPPFSPPAILFPIVWTILYALMGIGAARVHQSFLSRERSLGLNLFILQLVMNFFWSLIFFNTGAYGFALVWLILLWGLILAMILVFYRVDRIAALLQIPYFLWVTFAAYLNWGVWRLNS